VTVAQDPKNQNPKATFTAVCSARDHGGPQRRPDPDYHKPSTGLQSLASYRISTKRDSGKLFSTRGGRMRCGFTSRLSQTRTIGVSTHAQFIHRPEEAVEFRAAFQPRRAIVFAAVETDRESR
jgi:hypothetical protein